MTLQRRSTADSRLVRGLVLDHGGRHPDMPKSLKDAYILTLNVSLEYEQAETNAGFVYKTAEEREKLVESERIWLDERCKKIVELKRTVCTDDNNKTFCIINQKGVDPLSLDIFAKEGILCLRRAKRRNMERLTLACGGQQVLSLEDLSPEVLGFAGQVSQMTYGGDDETFTFVEDCQPPETSESKSSSASCTLLVQGPNELSTNQIKDAIKDGLRAVKNAVEDKAVVPGAGAFELAASMHLKEKIMPNISGAKKLGVQVFADALLVIPKTLAANSGFDVPHVLMKLQDERKDSGLPIGIDTKTGDALLPVEEGIYDTVRVKRQGLFLTTVLSTQLLLVDEVMRAGKAMGKMPDMDDPSMMQ